MNKKYAGPAPMDSVPSAEFLNATISKPHKAALDKMVPARPSKRTIKLKPKKAYEE